MDILLTEEKYYTAESDRKYMSPSLYKQYMKCEHRTEAMLRGDYTFPPLPALLIGQYVESVLLDEDPESFLSQHPEMFSTKLEVNVDTIAKVAEQFPELVTRNLTWKSGALSRAREAMPEAFTRISSLKADFEICDQVINRARRDNMLMEYLTDGDHQTVLTGMLGDMLWKGKTDTINVGKRRIVDLKVMCDMQRRGGVSFVEAMRYDEQLAIYRELAQQQFGGDWECYIAVVTKETPSGVELIRVPDWRCDQLIADLEASCVFLKTLRDGKREPTRCGVCDYCRDTHIITEAIDSDLVGMSHDELSAVGAI